MECITAQLSIKTCRELLDIQTRETMNQYLKTLDLFGSKRLGWEDLRRILELQTFLGLKHGRNSKSDFCDYTSEELATDFANHGINIEERFNRIQNKFLIRQKLPQGGQPIQERYKNGD